MKKKSGIIIAIIVVVLLVTASCYLFAPVAPINSISIEPRVITVREGEQEICDIVVDPPEMQGQVQIEYINTRDDLMEIYGNSNNVLVTGFVRGTATIKATTPDGKSAEAIVTISGAGGTAEDMYITSRNRIVVAQAGETMLLDATLIGGTTVQNDQMIWRVQDDRVASLLGGGPSVLLTAKAEGLTKITVSHPLAAQSFTIELMVNADGTQLEIDQYILNMKPGDYQEITAYVKNAPNDTIGSQLIWSLVVPDGETPVGSIIGTGPRVTVNALRQGNQRLMVKAPNGARAYADLIVAENASLELSKQDIKMKPETTYELTYDFNPAGDVVTIQSSSSSVLSYTHDAVNKCIVITALEEGTATLNIKTTSGMRATCYVMVAWPKELIIAEPAVQMQPGIERRIRYTISPPDSTLTATVDDVNVGTVLVDYGTKELVIKGKKEGRSRINLVGSNGVTKTLNVDYVISDWDVVLKFATVTASNEGHSQLLWESGGLLYCQIGEDGTGKLYVAPITAGLVYDVGFAVSGGMDEGRMTWTPNPDGISANYSYVPVWTMFDGTRDCGIITITVTHIASGQIRTFSVNLIGKFENG